MSLGRIFRLNESKAPRGISVDMELLIRLLEWSREEASSDVELHRLAENVESLSAGGKTLTMDDYEALMSDVSTGPHGQEAETY